MNNTITTTTITITGMTCSHCVNAVTDEICRLDNVTGVHVDLATGTATIESNDQNDPAAVAQQSMRLDTRWRREHRPAAERIRCRARRHVRHRIGAGVAFGPAASAKKTMPPAPMGEGVVSAKDGYRFVPATRRLATDGGTFRFVIEGPNGSPVVDFEQEHEKDLHFILVNRDLTIFHHVHPTRAADGTWSIDLPRCRPGPIAPLPISMSPHGPRLALGTDLSVAGDLQTNRTRRTSHHIDRRRL